MIDPTAPTSGAAATEPQTHASFYKLAEPYAKMGVPCFPLNPKDKLPPSWMKDFPIRATKYLPQLKQWSEKMPDANLALLGRDNQAGDICFLEFDQGTLAEAAAEMGQPVPEFRYHISGGKGLEHCVFRQTERSLNLGNRSTNKNGKEWFSLRMNARYVLGPGSIHPDTGRAYAVGNDIPPTDFPSWLVDWVNKYTAGEFDAAGGKDLPETDEGFDFASFREYLPFSLSQDGYWYIVSECHGVGRKHEHSKKTGIFWDGSHLAWKCFAQNCPWAYKPDGRKFTIGDLVHALATEIGPYGGTIWQEPSIVDDLEDLGAESSDEPAPAIKPNGHDKPAPAIATAEVVEPEQMLVKAIPPFPEDCLCGRLGERARRMEMPLGTAYPTVVGCYSVVPVVHEFARSRICTYVCLICPPGGGKNECIKRGLSVSGIPYGNEGYKRTTPGGDRQLMELLGDRPGKKRSDPRIPGPRKLLMVNNEIADVLKKASYDKSSLSSRLCDLWDENLTEIPDRGGTITADCRLSWIGGLPATLDKQERFLELFSAESIHGLYQRFVFGYTDEHWLHHDWMPSPETRGPIVDLEHAMEEHGLETNPFVRDFTAGALETYEAWTVDVPGFGRVRYNMKKFALLTAAADGLELCDEAHVEKAIRWAEWEICVRRAFLPSEALVGHKEAEFVNLLLPALMEKGAGTQFVSWRRVALDRKWDKRIDPSLQNRTVMALVRMGRLIQPEGDTPVKVGRVMVRQ